jgi:hypothetical protein
MSSDAIREYLRTISRQVIDGPIARDVILATLPRLTLEIIKQSHAEVFVRRSEDGCTIQVYRSMSASEFSAAVAIGQHLCRSTLSPAVSLPPPNPRPHLKPYGYRITSILFCEDSNITAAIPSTEVAKHDELDAAERLDVERSDTNRYRMGEQEEERMDTLRHVLQMMPSECRPDDQPYEVHTEVYDVHSLERVTDSVNISFSMGVGVKTDGLPTYLATFIAEDPPSVAHRTPATTRGFRGARASVVKSRRSLRFRMAQAGLPSACYRIPQRLGPDRTVGWRRSKLALRRGGHPSYLR